MTAPRAYTADEVTKQLLDHVRGLAKYWGTFEPQDGSTVTVQERCEGVAFSILSMLDGSSVAMPAFDLVVRPHPDDKEYHKSINESWYEDGIAISTVLHEQFYPQPEGD